MSDLLGSEREDLAGRDRLRARQVPDASGCSIVRTQGRQPGGDIRDVAVGVRQVGVAEEVGTLAGESSVIGVPPVGP